MKDYDEKINYLFCSDLVRTRQTLEIISKKIATETNNYTNSVHILPLAHEIIFDPLTIGNMQFENNVDTDKIIQNHMLGETELDWSTYDKFYGNSVRTSNIMIVKSFRHRDTSMISISIFIILRDRSLENWIKKRK